jgi:hypothetical protein
MLKSVSTKAKKYNYRVNLFSYNNYELQFMRLKLLKMFIFVLENEPYGMGVLRQNNKRKKI